ncbi:hypothetical protein ABT272_39675 [Streptomyces sp900105245]|uniref:Uncharacterized protein n=1 Tax=Streptomyces sp. 900105245 TaxID=3154379 RepID=A0ABV1UJ75_9ACTN
MRTLLPFKRPLAHAFHYYAFPLGILAEHPEAEDWVLSNYIHVVANEAAPLPFTFQIYDYSISPWLEVLRLNREWCTAHDDITKIVRDAVSLNFYVYLTLNERYVPERIAYQGQTDYAHDILIRGVDDQKDTFDIVGYDYQQMFRCTDLPQEDLFTAYHNTGPDPFYDVPLTMYRYNPLGSYRFDIGFIARSIGEYLESYDISRHFQGLRGPEGGVHGMESYGLLEHYLDSYGRGMIEYDIRRLQVLWEHKRLMVARMRRCADFVPDVGDLMTAYQRVERLAWTLRTMMIAHGTGHASGDFQTEAKTVLDDIRTTEQNVLAALVICLEAALQRGGGLHK